jgi:hypothetical protein
MISITPQESEYRKGLRDGFRAGPLVPRRDVYETDAEYVERLADFELAKLAHDRVVRGLQ